MVSATLVTKAGNDNNLNVFQQTDKENVTLKNKVSFYYKCNPGLPLRGLESLLMKTPNT